jgi:hypothetical protein
VFARPAGSHLGQRTSVGSGHHARGRARNGAVVVEHAEHERLEHHGLGERALDDEDGRARKVGVALPVAPDIARETVVGEPVEGGRVDDVVVAQVGELGILEAEIRDRLEQTPGAGHDTVAAPIGQSSREDLEDAVATGCARPQRGIQHREFVAVS